MGEDSDNHRRILNGGDDFQAATTVGAVFDIDIENKLSNRAQRMRAGERCA
jgi:hypothetical protein